MEYPQFATVISVELLHSLRNVQNLKKKLIPFVSNFINLKNAEFEHSSNLRSLIAIFIIEGIIKFSKYLLAEFTQPLIL